MSKRDRSRGGLTPDTKRALSPAVPGQSFASALGSAQNAPTTTTSVRKLEPVPETAEELFGGLQATLDQLDRVVVDETIAAQQEEAALKSIQGKRLALQLEQETLKNDRDQYVPVIASLILKKGSMEKEVRAFELKVRKDEFQGISVPDPPFVTEKRRSIATLDGKLKEIEISRKYAEFYHLGQIEALRLTIGEAEAKIEELDSQSVIEFFDKAVDIGFLSEPRRRGKDEKPRGNFFVGIQVYDLGPEIQRSVSSFHQNLFDALLGLAKQFPRLQNEEDAKHTWEIQQGSDISVSDLLEDREGRICLSFARPRDGKPEKPGYILIRSRGNERSRNTLIVEDTAGSARAFFKGEFVPSWVLTAERITFSTPDNLDRFGEEKCRRLTALGYWLRDAVRAAVAKERAELEAQVSTTPGETVEIATA